MEGLIFRIFRVCGYSPVTPRENNCVLSYPIAACCVGKLHFSQTRYEMDDRVHLGKLTR